jgi:hypothetical protein
MAGKQKTRPFSAIYLRLGCLLVMAMRLWHRFCSFFSLSE